MLGPRWGFLISMTVYKLLLLSGIQFTIADSLRIGTHCATLARKSNIKPTIAHQAEKGGKRFIVNKYPEHFIPAMQEIIIQHFASHNQPELVG